MKIETWDKQNRKPVNQIRRTISVEINNIKSPSMHLQLISCDKDGRWSLKAQKSSEKKNYSSSSNQ